MRIDGRPAPLPELRTVGEDRYAVVETTWMRHVVTLAFR
jgi:hypothetical protein